MTWAWKLPTSVHFNPFIIINHYNLSIVKRNSVTECFCSLASSSHRWSYPSVPTQPWLTRRTATTASQTTSRRTIVLSEGATTRPSRTSTRVTRRDEVAGSVLLHHSYLPISTGDGWVVESIIMSWTLYCLTQGRRSTVSVFVSICVCDHQCHMTVVYSWHFYWWLVKESVSGINAMNFGLSDYGFKVFKILSL